MKKTITIVAASLFLFGCGGVELLTFNSTDLGVSFDYYSQAYGQSVDVLEEGNKVSLMSEGVNIAGVEVVDLGEYEGELLDRLNEVLLNNSEACSLEELSSSKDKQVYNYNSHVFPFGDDFDVNCLLTSNVQYFPSVPGKVLIVGSGQAAPYETVEANDAFFESIKLTS